MSGEPTAPAGDRWIGVDVGGTKILAAVVEGQGEVLASASVATPSRREPAAVLEDEIVGVVTELAQGHRVAGVGVAAAGLVDADGRRVEFAPHLPWRGQDVVERLTERLGLRVALDNDANCAGLAEATYGAAREAASALVITLGTGIGGAVVVDGRLWRGAHGMAGEFGHMQVVPGGLPCECGGTGCWEQYCSGRAVARLMGKEPSSEAGPIMARAAREGDIQALRAYASVGEWLGRGVASLAAVLDPEVVVIGGGASAAGDLLLAPARRSLAEHLVGGPHRVAPSLVPAVLGPDAGVIGAALLARLSSSSRRGRRLPAPGGTGEA